jgi:ABC-type branched-subunit amino acid transport system ATPase component
MSGTAPPVLEVDDLTKSFRGVRALTGATFSVPGGRVTGLVGPNGSGKTTVLDCITGFTRPDGGTVRLAGRDVSGQAPHQRARIGVTRTFQQLRCYSGLSVLEHLRIARQAFDSTSWYDSWLRTRRYRRQNEVTRDKALELLHMVGLETFCDHPVDRLSFGQQKLVAMTCALMSDPDVLCLDEPLAGVSPRLVETIAGTVNELRRQGKTMLIVEHNMDFIAQAADHVVILVGGRALAEGDPSILSDDPRVYEAFLGAAP